MNEEPVALETIRWESDGTSTPWPDRVVLTNDHRWVLEEIVHWRRGEPTTLEELADYAVSKCEKNSISRAEAQALLIYIGLGDLAQIESARGYKYSPAT